MDIKYVKFADKNNNNDTFKKIHYEIKNVLTWCMARKNDGCQNSNPLGEWVSGTRNRIIEHLYNMNIQGPKIKNQISLVTWIFMVFSDQQYITAIWCIDNDIAVLQPWRDYWFGDRHIV